MLAINFHKNLLKRKGGIFLLRTIILAGCFFILPLLVFSQSCANYIPTRTPGITYNSIAATGNIVTYWRTQTVNQNDDNRSSPVPIGFDFYYCGVKYNTVSICTNGYIDFSTTVYDGNDCPGFPSGSGYVYCGVFNGAYCYSYRESAGAFFTQGYGGVAPNYYDGTYWALAPMYCDLWPNNGLLTVANNIKYKTSGTAPNRTFTVEYIQMADWTNPANSNYNFQIVLHETSGVIDYNYGSMNTTGSVTLYVCGINQKVSNTPALASEALVQQSPNTATFSSTATYSQTLPTSNSQLTFTPPCTAAPAGSLTFTAVTNISMQLNWTDWAANEVGYAIYYSVDGGVTYNYMAMTAANATSYNATNLYYQGTYFWKVYAVTEGCVSSALSASQATVAAGNFISKQTGNWGDGTTWLSGTVPTGGDNVTIADGHTVTMNGDYGASNLTVGQGTSGVLIIGNDATARNITIYGNITVNAGATFRTNTGFAATHLMNLYGNITNNGTFNMNPGTSVCNLTFLNNGNQTISGAGATTSFNTITPNLGNLLSNTLEVTSSNFSAPADFLKLTNANGTFKFSVPAAAVTLDAFTVATLIPSTCAIWMNSPNSIFNCHSTLTFRGDFTCSAGIVNAGDAADELFQSNGAIFTISGGTVNVSGRLTRPSYVAVTNFVMSGGTLNLNTMGSNDNAPATGTDPASPFCIDVSGSTFNMTGGTIIIRNTGSGSTANYAYSNRNCSSYNFSGGTLQIGDASTSSSGQTFYIYSDKPINNLVVDNTTTTKIGSIYDMKPPNPAYAITIGGNVTVGSGSTLISNNNNLNIAGNFTNNGTYTPGANTTTFNGTAAQTIGGSAATTCNNLTINNTSGTGVTLSKPATVSNVFTLTSGKIFTDATNLLILAAGATSSSGTTTSFVSGPMTKQAIANGSSFIFPVGKGTRWRRVEVSAIASGPSDFTTEYFDAGYGSYGVNAPLYNVSTLEYWVITKAVGATAAKVKLYWEDASVSGITDCPDLTVAHWNGVKWDEYVGTASGTCTGAGTGTVIMNSTNTSFSPFTFGSRLSGVNPLPVELFSFDAQPDGNVVNVKWKTASEFNSDYFLVQRSKDGTIFNNVIQVKGAGNSTTIKKYSAVDYEPYNDVSYYRLKQVDNDGKFMYSKIVSVKFHNDDVISVYPNPSDQGEPLNVNILGQNGKQVLVVVRDLQGREFYSRVILISSDTEVIAIDPSGKLAAGIYFIVATSDNNIYVKKIVIQ